MTLGRIIAWLRSRQRAVAAIIPILSLTVALLASSISVFQANMLYSQRSTPYQTALYVRQLQVAGDFATAAHEQSMLLADLRVACVARANGSVPDQDYKALIGDFRTGSDGLHKAYAATLLTLQDQFHTSAQRIWQVNDGILTNIVSNADSCRTFMTNWTQSHGDAQSQRLEQASSMLVTAMREQFGVDPLSSPEPIREARLAALKKDSTPLQ